MHLKSVVGLLRLLSFLAVAGLGTAWFAPSGVQTSKAIATQSIQKTAPSSTIVLDAIALPNNSNADDDDRDNDKDKKDREG